MTPQELEWWQTAKEDLKTCSNYNAINLLQIGWLVFNWSDKRLSNLRQAYWNKYGRAKWEAVCQTTTLNQGSLNLR